MVTIKSTLTISNAPSSVFEAFPNTVLVHTGTQSFGEKRKVSRSPEYSYEKLLWQNLVVNTTMYRREAFQRGGGYAPEMVHGFVRARFFLDAVEVKRLPDVLHMRIRAEQAHIEFLVLGGTAQGRGVATPHLRAQPRAVCRSQCEFDQYIRQAHERLRTMHAARYKRQARYQHAGYGVLVVVPPGVIGLLVAAG